MTEPDPFFHKTVIWARDIASGIYYEVAGQFDTDNHFTLLTNGSGGSTGGGGTPSAGQPIGAGSFLFWTYPS